MDSSGYYLKQRPLSVAVSTKNLTSSATHSLATIAHGPDLTQTPTFVLLSSFESSFL